MRAISEYHQLVETAISSTSFPENPKDLYLPLRYFLSLGGKRMRPVMVVLSHEMFGGKAERVIPQALAYEFFHNFTLIHDDIMDKAPLRRGLATVHTKWNESTAILSGDVLFVKSMELLSQCDANYLQPLQKLFFKTATEVCEGQQMDMDFENQDDVSISEYLEMITLKTAVLPAACLASGALLANASETDIEHIYAFGKNLGIAFQLKDDLLDIFGDEEKFGKQKGGDILAGKKTFLLLTALKDAETSQKKKLQERMKNNSADKVNAVTVMYNEMKVAEKTENEMNHYFQLAMNHLSKINLPEKNKQPVKELALQLMARVS